MIRKHTLSDMHAHTLGPVSLWGVNGISVWLIVVAFRPWRLFHYSAELHSLSTLRLHMQADETHWQVNTHKVGCSRRSERQKHTTLSLMANKDSKGGHMVQYVFLRTCVLFLVSLGFVVQKKVTKNSH